MLLQKTNEIDQKMYLKIRCVPKSKGGKEKTVHQNAMVRSRNVQGDAKVKRRTKKTEMYQKSNSWHRDKPKISKRNKESEVDQKSDVLSKLHVRTTIQRWTKSSGVNQNSQVHQNTRGRPKTAPGRTWYYYRPRSRRLESSPDLRWRPSTDVTPGGPLTASTTRGSEMDRRNIVL